MDFHTSLGWLYGQSVEELGRLMEIHEEMAKEAGAGGGR